MRTVQTSELQDSEELRRFVTDFPAVIKQMGLTELKTHFGWDAVFRSNLSAVLFEPDLKEPQLRIERGTGDPIPATEFGIYLRVPVPFKILDLTKWAKTQGNKWWGELLNKKYLETFYGKREIQQCAQRDPGFQRYFERGAVTISPVSTGDVARINMERQELEGFVNKVLKSEKQTCKPERLQYSQSKDAIKKAVFPKVESIKKDIENFQAPIKEARRLWKEKEVEASQFNDHYPMQPWPPELDERADLIKEKGYTTQEQIDSDPDFKKINEALKVHDQVAALRMEKLDQIQKDERLLQVEYQSLSRELKALKEKAKDLSIETYAPLRKDREAAEDNLIDCLRSVGEDAEALAIEKIYPRKNPAPNPQSLSPSP